MTVLIVDDDPVSRHLYAKTLERMRQDAVEVASADAALEWLKNDASATMIIMDTDLPGRMNGLRFFAFLRSNPRYAKIPVIVASGKAEEKDVRDAIAAGVRNFLVKPVRPATLTEKVNELLIRATPVLESKFDAMARLEVDEVEYRFLAEKAESRLDELIARLRDAQDRSDLVERFSLLPRFRDPAALLGAGRLLDAIAVAGDPSEMNQQQRNSAFEMVLSEANILRQELSKVTRRG